MYFSKKTVKIEVCFLLWQFAKKFSAISQVPAAMVPEKFDVIKVLAFRVKTSSRTLAALRLVPRYTTKKSLLELRHVAKSSGSKVTVYTSLGVLLYGQ
jgi:hypothetical protein